jgi:putative DNA base modification enzyme with NMAD domain
LQVFLLRVGIDTGSGGIHGPVFSDGRFEFIPIPDGKISTEERTYGNTVGRYGRRFVEYFPSQRQAVRTATRMHVDPEFQSFTYGDPTAPKRGLLDLRRGDLLVFYAGLQAWPVNSDPAALYIVGYFEVSLVGLASMFTAAQIEEFSLNSHVRQPAVFASQRDRLILIKGGPGSRLLERVGEPISEYGVNVVGQPLKVLSRSMFEVFGGFGGRNSLQRSNPRRVPAAFTDRAAAFVRSLP